MRTTRTGEEFATQLFELLKAEGISALSVAQMATRLRCSRRRLYELAPSKEALLHLAARAHFDQMLREGFEAAAREPDPARAIAAYLRVGVTSTVTLSPAFLRDLESSSEGREIFDRYQIARAEGVRRILEDGIRRGVFTAHNQFVATEVLLGASLRLRRSAFLAEAGLTISQAFEEAYALILGGLLAPSRRRKGPATLAPRSEGSRRQGNTEQSPRKLPKS
ncbi:TetR/AcrR family transcriptional regulator [Quisquiliibacterium transsilvanicum]|uniref:AcrR family transcriptional regulator n=1 Tax=Quisquiliibacterium transsilvanicum TaxID=1549638 RepID=A0A7W8HIJ3_9BURK|nr:TetR/AcrR family transcriptional regulator [Quisquiliibacterium transsilvanicum]MBB5272734.1 AcrR family transcriptional regulator [Quisquiliibacterium transsilvanicum]